VVADYLTKVAQRAVPGYLLRGEGLRLQAA
jgi:hypothetical protein